MRSRGPLGGAGSGRMTQEAEGPALALTILLGPNQSASESVTEPRYEPMLSWFQSSGTWSTATPKAFPGNSHTSCDDDFGVGIPFSSLTYFFQDFLCHFHISPYSRGPGRQHVRLCGFCVFIFTVSLSVRE